MRSTLASPASASATATSISTPSSSRRRTATSQYVPQMLEMAGLARRRRNRRAEVVALETRIAEAHWTRAESRNRDKTYNPMTLAELEAQAPGFPWADLPGSRPDSSAPSAPSSARTPPFPSSPGSSPRPTCRPSRPGRRSTPPTTSSPLLSKRFVDANFEFRSKFLNGQPQQRDRWKRGVAFAENAMGEAIGRDYVAPLLPARRQGEDGPARRRPARRDEGADRAARSGWARRPRPRP